MRILRLTLFFKSIMIIIIISKSMAAIFSMMVILCFIFMATLAQYDQHPGSVCKLGSQSSQLKTNFFRVLGYIQQGWPRPLGARGARSPKLPRRAEALASRPFINCRGAKFWNLLLVQLLLRILLCPVGAG